MPKTVYRCEFCGQVYDDELAASNCEFDHCKAGEVALMPGSFLLGKLGRWPDRVVLVADDGKGRVYGRTGDYEPTKEMIQQYVYGPAGSEEEEPPEDNKGESEDE